MDIVSRFGNLDEFIYTKNLVLLKLEEPWPFTRHPLEGFTIASEDGLLVGTNMKGLLTNRRALGSIRVSGALFAGCCRLAATCGEILKGMDALVVVHNTDLVVDIVARFPSISVLVLHHDARVQLGERPRVPSRERSRLERIFGNSSGAGADCLVLSTGTLSSLSASCPRVRDDDVALPSTFLCK